MPQAKRKVPDTPAAAVDTTGQPPMVQLRIAIRDGDDEGVEEIRRSIDLLNVQVDFCRLLIFEHDKLLPICRECVGASERVLPLDREIAAIRQIVPANLDDAHELPVKLEEMRAEVQRELTRAVRGRKAAGEALAIRSILPELFIGEPDVPCDPFAEQERITAEERLRMSICGSPPSYPPQVIRDRIDKLSGPDYLADLGRPEPIPQRRRRRLIGTK